MSLLQTNSAPELSFIFSFCRTLNTASRSEFEPNSITETFVGTRSSRLPLWTWSYRMGRQVPGLAAKILFRVSTLLCRSLSQNPWIANDLFAGSRRFNWLYNDWRSGDWDVMPVPLSNLLTRLLTLSTSTCNSSNLTWVTILLSTCSSSVCTDTYCCWRTSNFVSTLLLPARTSWNKASKHNASSCRFFEHTHACSQV